MLLPDYVNRGLAANDRVKYLFSLLQGASLQALNPQVKQPDLHAERSVLSSAGVWTRRMAFAQRSFDTVCGCTAP
jgi:hypothetical protein